MKRKHTSWLFMVLLAGLGGGCGKNAPDCLQSSGDLFREEVAVPEFSAITVYENVRLVLLQGPEQQVVLETGENIRPDISASVKEGMLELRNENGCNLFRKYGQTTFFVTTPDLVSIRSSTGWPIRSDGVLAFEDLSLVSESFNNPETGTTDGAFELALNTGAVRLVANGISSFELRGETGLLTITIAAGDARVDASELRARRVQLNHRGSNDLRVRPTDRIDGVIRGYGDVLSFNRPDTVQVSEQYRGQLLFVD